MGFGDIIPQKLVRVSLSISFSPTHDCSSRGRLEGTFIVWIVVNVQDPSFDGGSTGQFCELTYVWVRGLDSGVWLLDLGLLVT